MPEFAMRSYLAVLTYYWKTCDVDDVQRILHRPRLSDAQVESARVHHTRPPFGIAGLPADVQARARRVLAMELRR